MGAVAAEIAEVRGSKIRRPERVVMSSQGWLNLVDDVRRHLHQHALPVTTKRILSWLDTNATVELQAAVEAGYVPANWADRH